LAPIRSCGDPAAQRNAQGGALREQQSGVTRCRRRPISSKSLVRSGSTARGWLIPARLKYPLVDAVAIYFLDAALAAAFASRWCAGSKVEIVDHAP
jgi:hypothetical protein